MGRSALQPGFQCTASGVSVHCVRTCSALRPKQSQTHLQGQMLNEGFSRKRLRGRLQTFAGTVAMLCV